jgi:recombination protein RecA
MATTPAPKKKLEVKEAPKVNTEMAKLVAASVASIEKAYGVGSIMKLGGVNSSNLIHKDIIPTGSLSLDLATGVNGIPKGRIIEIYGDAGAGKTTLTLHIVAQAQKLGGICAFCDAEHALDIDYARELGVDVDNLLISQPENGETALSIVEQLAKGGGVSVIVIDSVAALTPKAELEGDIGQSHMGLQARMMGQAMRMLTSAISKNNVLVIFINQLRQKIGVFFGDPNVTTGGLALKFYTSIRMEVKRIGAVKLGSGEAAEIIGNRTVVRVVKNKVSSPFKKAEFDIIYGKGISYEGDVLDLAVARDLVKKGGAWYSYEESQLGQGREAAKEYLKNNPKITEEIANKVKAIGYINQAGK